MKAVLFLCLFAFMICEKDIIDIGKCIYKAPLVKELINDVIVAFATKDYSKLLPKIKESIPELMQIVLGCLVDTKEDQPKLANFSPFFIYSGNCSKECFLGSLPGIIYDEKDKTNCFKRCMEKYKH